MKRKKEKGRQIKFQAYSLCLSQLESPPTHQWVTQASAPGSPGPKDWVGHIDCKKLPEQWVHSLRRGPCAPQSPPPRRRWLRVESNLGCIKKRTGAQVALAAPALVEPIASASAACWQLYGASGLGGEPTRRRRRRRELRAGCCEHCQGRGLARPRC